MRFCFLLYFVYSSFAFGIVESNRTLKTCMYFSVNSDIIKCNDGTFYKKKITDFNNFSNFYIHTKDIYNETSRNNKELIFIERPYYPTNNIYRSIGK